jgi:acetyl esterase/lipase
LPINHLVVNRHKLPPAPSIAYGVHPDQVANLHLPAREGGPWPCVVLIHGGFWRTGWDRTLMTPLAIDLARRGLAAWNIEYRRVGQDGGGWPGTLQDVAAAVDRIAEVDEVDVTRIVPCGHSAGGHLALWLAARHRLAPGLPGSDPGVRPVAAIAQAGVCDLERAWRDGLGRSAADDLLGSFEREPERYAAASPAALAPLGVPQLLVHGEADDIVPIAQSRDYAALEPEAELVALPDADHFDVIDVGHAAWAAVTDRLPALLAS